MQKSDVRYCYGYEPLNNDKSKDQKYSEAKNHNYLLTTNNNSRDKDLPGQALGWFSKKNFYLNKEG